MRTHRAVLLACAFALLAGCSRGPAISPAGRTGIEGKVTIGPTCPVVRQGSPCPDRPYQARIDIKDSSGKVVQSFIAAADGSFHVDIAPGTYTLVPRNGRPLPRAEPVTVVVKEGAYTHADISYDSGIR